MANVKAAADAAKNLAKQYRAVLDIVEVLDEIGNLESAQREALKSAEKARADRATAQSELRSVASAVEAGEVKLVGLKRKVKYANLSTITEAARQEAVVIVANANRQVAESISLANAAEKQRTKHHNAVTAERADKIKGLENREAELNASIDALQKTIDRMRAKFD